MNQELIRLIESERDWSWSLVGLITLVLALALRALFLRNILHTMKMRNRSWYKRTLIYYQKRSLPGWIFFGLFILGIVLLWRMEASFLKYLSFLEWFLIFVTLFFLSVFFHLRAYACSIVEAVQEHVSMDREL